MITVDLSKNGSKGAILKLLDKLGMRVEAQLFKSEVALELIDEEGDPPPRAKRRAWDAMVLRYVPLADGVAMGVLRVDDTPRESSVTQEAAGEPPVPVEPSAPKGSGGRFGVLPADWPELPETASWVDELEWVYQNGILVITEKPNGPAQYHWDRARTPPPSNGAKLLMKLLAESRKNFMDLLGKAKTNTDGVEAEDVKKEKRRIGEVEAILDKFLETTKKEDGVNELSAVSGNETTKESDESDGLSGLPTEA